MMHLRGKLTGVDIARIGDLLSSVHCWIENPKTLPKKEEVITWIDKFLLEETILTQDSYGISNSILSSRIYI
jgi:hypothetical protein